MNCKRCSAELSGKQTSYCSQRCSKLHLKSLYRKRRKEHIRAYDRKYRSLGIKPMNGDEVKDYVRAFGGRCWRCRSTINLNIHHWRPLRLGGTNDTQNLSLFCFTCHQFLHRIFPVEAFWIREIPAHDTDERVVN